VNCYGNCSSGWEICILPAPLSRGACRRSSSFSVISRIHQHLVLMPDVFSRVAPWRFDSFGSETAWRPFWVGKRRELVNWNPYEALLKSLLCSRSPLCKAVFSMSQRQTASCPAVSETSGLDDLPRPWYLFFRRAWPWYRAFRGSSEHRFLHARPPHYPCSTLVASCMPGALAHRRRAPLRKARF
jgi:hypothetical protein